MKKSILTLLLILCVYVNGFSSFGCTIEGPSIACKLERILVQFDTDCEFTEVKVTAYSVVNGTQELAIVENITDNSAEVIFFNGGDSEVIVRYFQGSTLVTICNLNVFVFDEEPINAIGALSNFVDDQITCQQIDLEFSMFIECPECPYYWTLNDEVIEIEEEAAVIGTLLFIDGLLEVEGIGSYTFCHSILKPDSSCFVRDCIDIELVDLDVTPAFSLDEGNGMFCSGSSHQFINETIIEDVVDYQWTVQYDSLIWKYTTEDLDFDFNLPGEYNVSLQYFVNGNDCESVITSMIVNVSDEPIIPISCNSNSCQDTLFTYRALADCEEYNWNIDESLGEIVSNDGATITVKWYDTDQYKETKVSVFIGSCSEDACEESFIELALFPNNINIEGAKGICDRGTEWYITDFIPDAEYAWEIELSDSVSGISPQIIDIENNRIRIAYNSYVGNLAIRVEATIPSRACSVSTEISTSSIVINTNDNLCPGDLFKASVTPKLDQDVIWTLTNPSVNYFNQQTISGQNQFFAFDLSNAGTYMLSVSFPEQDFSCDEDIPLTILDNPNVTLVGPQYVCPGDSATYTLADLGGNDLVEWTIFQNNTSIDLIGNEITILWEEGGAPYNIKVKRTTEVMPDQFCDSQSETYAINAYENQNFEIDGPKVVCYDSQASYQLINGAGSFDWEIDPPYMGTILQGEDSELINIQWHYAPDISFATVLMTNEICDSTYSSQVEVVFDQYPAFILAPDSICQNSFEEIMVGDFTSFQSIKYYIDSVLIGEDRLTQGYTFQDSGLINITVEIINPDNCPGTVKVSKDIYVVPNPVFNYITSLSIIQCPKESFQDVTVSVDFLNPEAYYAWSIDGVIVNEGFGDESVYNQIVTKEMILSGAQVMRLEITSPEGCSTSRSLKLEYDCAGDSMACACIGSPDVEINIERHECNLVSLSGSLNFSVVINPQWEFTVDGEQIIIPINGPEDLILDSIYLTEGVTGTTFEIAGLCEGLLVSEEAVLDTVLCDLSPQETARLYAPAVDEVFICNEDLTYDVVLAEKVLMSQEPPFNSVITWQINGIEYEGVSIILEDVEGGTILDIIITQCSLDGTYCCAQTTEVIVPDRFAPEIILPNGTCENELWLFSLDAKRSEIVSTLWDFGDESGSTLFSTEKGFPDSLAHDISVVVTNELGCVATSEITVQSFQNNIEGEILFESDPCASSALLTYVENSESTIISYEWNFQNAPDSAIVEVVRSGSYVVTVTDINGCTAISSIPNVDVNESFVGGLRFQPENCGNATVSILTNGEYTYNWFVDGEETNATSFVNLFFPGEYEVKVISTSNLTGQKCDSIVETIEVFPLPEKPLIVEEKTFCDPPITKLSLSNYSSAEWRYNNGYSEEGEAIFVTEIGSYSASVEDENGCRNTSSISTSGTEIPFDDIAYPCIQACREDLDSLQITIPGLDQLAQDWTWITVDSAGSEYEIAPSMGIITPLTITSEMYEYVQLQITKDECDLRSDRIPLDIQICDLPEPPTEIICEEIDSDHASCGQSIYKCLVSEQNGGPKLYFEGNVIFPMGAVLCSEDSLSVSLNNGQIIITDLLYEEIEGKIMAFYSANILITDPEDYKENGTIIKFDFCDEEGEVSSCYEYALPYRTCGKDFDCLIDYEGISAGSNQTVDINYCLNLSEVIQDNCTLTEYKLEVLLSGDVSVKTIYTQTIDGEFGELQCISIPVSQEDFYGGEFNCMEIMIEGDCPGIKCSEYQCGIFGNLNLVGNNEVPSAKENSALQEQEKREEISPEPKSSFTVFPNPSSGLMTFHFSYKTNEKTANDRNEIIIKNSVGQTIKSINLVEKTGIDEDLSNEQPGLYLAYLVRNGVLISTKKFLIIK